VGKVGSIGIINHGAHREARRLRDSTFTTFLGGPEERRKERRSIPKTPTRGPGNTFALPTFHPANSVQKKESSELVTPGTTMSPEHANYSGSDVDPQDVRSLGGGGGGCVKRTVGCAAHYGFEKSKGDDMKWEPRCCTEKKGGKTGHGTK